MKEKITIRDIAERAGTSKTTVSFFLNGKTDKMSEETQARIAQVIKETNYRPSIAARSLNAKETRLSLEISPTRLPIKSLKELMILQEIIVTS